MSENKCKVGHADGMCYCTEDKIEPLTTLTTPTLEENESMTDTTTKIRIALGELGATWEDPELIVQNILEIFKEEKAQAISTAKRETLREVRDTIWQLREDCRNDGGIQHLRTYDHIITHLESELTV